MLKRILPFLLAVASSLTASASAQASLQYNRCPTGDDYTVVAYPEQPPKGDTGHLSLQLNGSSIHYFPLGNSSACGLYVYVVGQSQPIKVQAHNVNDYTLPKGDSLDHAIYVGQIYNPSDPKGTDCDVPWDAGWDQGVGFFGDTTQFNMTISPQGTAPLDSFSVHPLAGEWICAGAWDLTNPTDSGTSNAIGGVSVKAGSGRKITQFQFNTALAPVPRDVYSVPAKPGTPAVSNVTASGATVSWPANTEQDLDGYYVYLNGSQYGGKIQVTSLNLTGLTDATSYSVTVAAVDVDGNVSPQSDPTSFTTLDGTPPTVSFTAPSGTVSGSSVAVSVSASDNVGVDHVTYQLPGSGQQTVTGGGSFATTWDSTKVSNGSQTLTATAYDAAGNASAPATVTVTVNNQVGTCTGGQVGTPPNCSCPSGTHRNGNQCVANTCTGGQVGTWPDCHNPTCVDFGNCPPPPPQRPSVFGVKVPRSARRGKTLAGQFHVSCHAANCRLHVDLKVGKKRLTVRPHWQNGLVKFRFKLRGRQVGQHHYVYLEAQTSNAGGSTAISRRIKIRQ